MKRTTTLLLTILIFVNLFANGSLRISDVRNSWWWEQGTINGAVFTVEPKGLYAHCSMSLDFTANNLVFESDDSLEVQMDFELPEGAIVTDLYLWINDSAVRADIYDKWTASLIYESIVQRRIDPAILTKNQNNTYNIKVFPLMVDMPRWIKIEYLVPVTTSQNGYCSVPIPVEILKLSNETPETFNVLYNGCADSTELYILENDTLAFGTYKMEDGSKILGTGLGDAFDYSSVTLQYPDPSVNYNLSVFREEDSNEGFFQFQFQPGEFFDETKNKKALYLIDFIDNKCNQMGAVQFIDQLSNSLQENFQAGDSINVIFSGTKSLFLEDNWIDCSEGSIEDAFSGLTDSVFNTYSNLPNLLSDGIEYLKNSGDECPIVLISSSNYIHTNLEANDLINDVLDLIGDRSIPIFVLDMNTENIYTYIGTNNYINQGYFYSFLSQMTYGTASSIHDKDFRSMFNSAASKLGGFMLNVDVDIDTKNGYTYSKYDLFGNGVLTYYYDTWSIIGKYMGDFPFSLTVNAQLQGGELLSKELMLEEYDIYQADSTLATLWTNSYINTLMAQGQSKDVMNQVIHHSIKERILTPYTAFLVLEPGFVPDISNEPNIPIDVEITDDVWWWGLETETIVEESNGLDLVLYPNPVSDVANLAFTLSEPAMVRVELIDIHGKTVSLLIDDYFSAGQHNTNFEVFGLAPGMYICRIIIGGQEVKNEKIMVM